MKIVSSSSVTSWHIDGETMETVTGFILLGFKINADGDCSHEIKRRLFLGRKAMTNPDSILKSRDITLPTKVHLVKAMVFLVVMCESLIIKKVEGGSTDAFELWCWRRLSAVPWTARRSNQSILKEISPEYSLEGLMLKLQLQYFVATWCKELTCWKRPWCRERLKAGKEGDDRGWDGGMAAPTRWTWVWHKLQELVMDRETWRAVIYGVAKSCTQLNDWTELNLSNWQRINLKNVHATPEALFQLYKQPNEKKWTKGLNGHFYKDDREMANKHMKRYSTSLMIREIQIKTTARYHFMPVRMAAIQKSTNNKCWRACREKGTVLHCW